MATLLAVPTTLNTAKALVAVGADHLVDVLDGLRRVVLVVLVLDLDLVLLAGDLDAAVVVDLVEVGLVALGDLGEGRGEAGLRERRRQRDGVALDAGGAGVGAVRGVDRRAGLAVAVAVAAAAAELPPPPVSSLRPLQDAGQERPATASRSSATRRAVRDRVYMGCLLGGWTGSGWRGGSGEVAGAP